MTNLPAILSTLDQEITALTEQLQPSRPEFIAECLHKLKSGGMLVPKSISAAEFLNEYTIALNGVPIHGLMVAVAKLKRGEYPVPSDFMPLPAALAAMARAECRVMIDDIARLREKKNTLEFIAAPPEVTTEERKRQVERVRDMRKNFLRQHQESKTATFAAGHIPMDNDQADYWSKIQDLPDAKSVDADQAAFRRKIAGEIAAVEPRADPIEPPAGATDDIEW